MHRLHHPSRSCLMHFSRYPNSKRPISSPAATTFQNTRIRKKASRLPSEPAQQKERDTCTVMQPGKQDMQVHPHRAIEPPSIALSTCRIRNMPQQPQDRDKRLTSVMCNAILSVLYHELSPPFPTTSMYPVCHAARHSLRSRL